MEPNEFYVYPGGSYFSCGGCGSSLSPYQPERRPYKPRVCCYNHDCPKYLVVLMIGEEHRIAAFDTGERAPDPRIAIAGGPTTAFQAQNTTHTIAGGNIPGQTIIAINEAGEVLPPRVG